MTPFSRPAKTPSRLSRSLIWRLDLYALAASATGIGLAQPAEAKIVFTPAHLPIVRTINLDLNHDGIVDFKLGFFALGGGEGFLDATSIGQNRVWGSGNFASHLLAGKRVKPNPQKFAKGAYCGSSNSARTCKGLLSDFYRSGVYSSKGPWAGTTDGYLGLKFHIKGKTHFGWARLQFINKQWVLTGYAYETVVGAAISTGRRKGPEKISSADQTSPAVRLTSVPQSATLGMLASGSVSLIAWRPKPVAPEVQAT